jgi:glycosyltransferase involved in cell wall biosynthesis
MLHVAQISFFYDPQGRSPVELLSAWPTMVDVAEAALHSGVRVSVIQACTHTEHLERNGVHYHFLPVHDALFRNLLLGLGADVLHVHGLDCPRQVAALAEFMPQTPIILQDHASRPPRLWRRSAWRSGMAAAAGISFCALNQAQPFARARLVGANTRLYEVPESTSRFVPGDRAEARRATAIEGDPAILWVGHLDANKDPLTVLEGISAAIRELPQLQFYCCFGNAPLLHVIQNRIASDAPLRNKVHLLGRLPHARIELLMRAADIFVLGSHREGSGYSLIEALACGLPPVVTDIPSFRSLTKEGSVGKLWPCDDSRALCQALLSVANCSGSVQRAAVRTHFDRELSTSALGVKLSAMYADVLARNRNAARAQVAS